MTGVGIAIQTLVGKLLTPVLRRTVFSRNTRSATEDLKSYMKRPA